MRQPNSNKRYEVEQTMINKKSSIVTLPKIPRKPKISLHFPNLNVPIESSEHGPRHVLPVLTSTPPASAPNDNAPRYLPFPVPKPRRNIPKNTAFEIFDPKSSFVLDADTEPNDESPETAAKSNDYSIPISLSIEAYDSGIVGSSFSKTLQEWNTIRAPQYLEISQIAPEGVNLRQKVLPQT